MKKPLGIETNFLKLVYKIFAQRKNRQKNI